MAQFTQTNKTLPHELLDRFKYEVAAQEGLSEKIANQGWPNMTAKECGQVGGRIGGRMVKVMIQYAEQVLQHGGKI
jgi:hypothetical protein